ncbi:MAG: hypothetical protein VX529_08130 [Pseudomonadota bacterium]|nr:hypothetical protein [Pseudomonadota bacterium]
MVTVPAEDTFETFTVTSSSTGPFAFDFPYFAKTDLEVWVGTTQLSQSGFTLTNGSGSSTAGYDGGSVTLVSAVENTTVYIVRNVVAERTSNLSAGGLTGIAVNAALNKLTMHAQDRQRDDERSLRVVPGETGFNLPVAADRANNFLGFDSSGNVLMTPIGDVAAITARLDEIETLSDPDVLATLDAIFADLAVANTIGAAAALLDVSAPGLVCKATDGSPVSRTLAVGTGLSISNATGGGGNPTISLHGNLVAIAGITPTDGVFLVGNGTTWVAESGATARASLGLTIGTNVLAYDANLQAFVTAFTLPESDGTVGQVLTTDGSGGLTWEDGGGGGSGDLVSTNNLSDLVSPQTARDNLGVEIGVDVQSWTKGFVNVADYGVDLTGTTADTTGVANALSALVAQGGGVLYFPPGTYKRDAELTITNSNIHVVHAPGAVIDCSNLSYNSAVRNSGCAISFEGTYVGSTTLASSAAKGATSISVASATGIAVGQLVMLSSTKLLYDASGLDAKYTDINRVVGVSGTTVTLEYPLHLPFTTSGETVTLFCFDVLENVSVKGGRFLGGGVTENLGNGLGRTCVNFGGCRHVSVSGVIAVGFQGSAIWTEYCEDVLRENNYVDGAPAGTVIVEGQTSGFYGAYATRCRDVRDTGNRGVRVRHLCDALEAQEVIQSENKCYNSHKAAFGSHESVHGLKVSNNKAYNCYAGGAARAFTSKWQGNEFLSCTTAGLTTTVEVTGDEAGRLEITGNTMTVTDEVSAFATAITISGYYDPLIIADNVLESEGSRTVLLTARNLRNVAIRDNTITTTNATGYCLRIETPEESMVGVYIENNTWNGYIVNGLRINGCADITAPADQIMIRDNKGYAGGDSGNCIYLIADGGYWGDNVIIRDNWQNNDYSACVAIDTSPVGRFKSHPINENNVEYVPSAGASLTTRPRYIAGYNTSAVLTGDSTIHQGGVIVNSQPTGSDPIEWVCTVGGTEGTITGVTGSISSGTNTLTLSGNDGIKVYNGCWVTIAGLGSARVVGLSSDFATATLNSNAGSTVSGAGVTRRNPTFSNGPTLGAT